MASEAIVPMPLTAQAFAPFGDVLEVNEHGEQFAINQGFTTRYHRLGDVECAGDHSVGIISIFRSTPLPLPIKITMMERHPLGSQAFIPMSGQPYLVVVAPKGDFEPNKIKVFLAAANQGVNYHTGTWHHFCLALNQVSDFVVIDRQGDGNNCDEIVLEESKQFTINI